MASQFNKTKIAFKTVLILLFLLVFNLQIGNAFGENTDKITTIHIATPAWEGQTNEDGTGLFFDTVRSVYEPEGITMTFEIVPWKRAVQTVISKKADALLDIYRENIEKGMLAPQYPMLVEYTVAVFRKDKIKEWKGVKSLDGMRAVWIRDYDYHKNRHFQNITFKWEEIDEYDTAWRLLSRDRTDVYLDALTDVRHYIRSNNMDMNVYQMETVGADKGYIAFSISQKSEKLVKIYDKRIKKLFQSGELKKIFEKWDYPFPADAWEK